MPSAPGAAAATFGPEPGTTLRRRHRPVPAEHHRTLQLFLSLGISGQHLTACRTVVWMRSARCRGQGDATPMPLSDSFLIIVRKVSLLYISSADYDIRIRVTFV